MAGNAGNKSPEAPTHLFQLLQGAQGVHRGTPMGTLEGEVASGEVSQEPLHHRLWRMEKNHAKGMNII